MLRKRYQQNQRHLSSQNSPHGISSNFVNLHYADMSETDILKAFSDWIQIEVAEGEASVNTMRSYLSTTRGFLNWCRIRNLVPLETTENHIKLYRSHLVREGYRRGSIGTKLSGIRRFYDAVCQWGIRVDNPASTVKAKRELTSKAEKIAEKYISDRDAFLSLYQLPDASTPKGARDCTILRILCFTGIRVSELCGINIRDLELDVSSHILIRSGKGRKRRSVPLGEEDVSIIRRWLQIRDEIVSPEIQAVFITLDNRTKGRRISTRGVRSIVDTYLEEAGLKQPGRSCHALRHSLATWLLDAGVPTEAIADLLGHSSVAITAVYAKVVDLHKYTPSEILTKKLD